MSFFENLFHDLRYAYFSFNLDPTIKCNTQFFGAVRRTSFCLDNLIHGRTSPSLRPYIPEFLAYPGDGRKFSPRIRLLKYIFVVRLSIFFYLIFSSHRGKSFRGMTRRGRYLSHATPVDENNCYDGREIDFSRQITCVLRGIFRPN